MTFKIDEDFAWFLEQFGFPTLSYDAVGQEIKKFSGRVPNRLIEYWKEFGFCSFKDGLFWMVNPSHYESTLNSWLLNTNIPNFDNYHVIARSAFGDMYLWGEKSGFKYKINVTNLWIVEQEGDEKLISKEKSKECIQDFFYTTDPEYVDKEDESDQFLFERAVKKFGPLAPDEMFTFEPALFLGGEQTLNTINKVNIFVQLELLAKMGTPQIMDINGLAKKAFS